MSKKIAAVFLFFFIAFTTDTMADKSAVTIEGPDAAAKGSEITIRINVTHDGNNFFHYTDKVWVQANGEEIARWNFSWNDRPESERFSKEIKVMITDTTEITAQANCNIHGSAGQAVLRINLKP